MAVDYQVLLRSVKVKENAERTIQTPLHGINNGFIVCADQAPTRRTNRGARKLEIPVLRQTTRGVHVRKTFIRMCLHQLLVAAIFLHPDNSPKLGKVKVKVKVNVYLYSASS